MRIGVCGGPYGNPYALRAFVADARRRGCERLYCLATWAGSAPRCGVTSSRVGSDWAVLSILS
jgi:hypothetical protein